MATTHIKRSASASRLVNYAEKRAVLKDGLNIDVDYAKSQLKRVREVYGNQGKTQAYASRISFSPKELDPSNKKDQQKALEIAKEVYQKTYPNQQVALYEHADTDALHIHAVIGAINLAQLTKRRQFTSVYQREKGIEIKKKLSDYPWINQNLSCSEIVQKDLKNLKIKT